MIDLKALSDGDVVEGQLAIRSMDGAGEGLRDYSNKPGRFFVIRVGNSVGDITLKYWGSKNPENVKKLFSSLEVGEVVSLKGRCAHDSYSKELVISVNEEAKYGAPQESLKKSPVGEFNPEDFMPALPEERIRSLAVKQNEIIQGIGDSHMKALLEGIFLDKSFAKIFKKTPAARRHHHNYIGGLLEHTINVARLCETICSFYPLDRDLLITGALLHDIGKTKEYVVKASVDISDEGRFIGHLPLGVEMVRREIESLEDFPDATKLKVIHMILSHHGELEKGSPKEPAFPEAMALYHADYMDAFVKNTLQEAEGAGEEDEWIYSKTFKRFIHTKKA
jgi:3'-5' exoribonuclease